MVVSITWIVSLCYFRHACESANENGIDINNAKTAVANVPITNARAPNS